MRILQKFARTGDLTMKTKLIALVSIVCFFTNISISYAGTWIKKTTFDKGSNNSKNEITNEKTPESSTKGLYAQHWADENNFGLSITAWLRNDKDSVSSPKEIFGNISNGHITYSYQWSERNPPLTAFSSEWTEVFYVQNKGDCDNRSLFNNKGEADVDGILQFDFAGGPDDILDEDYGLQLTTTAENRENKTRKNPKGYLRFGDESKYSEPSWLDKSDKGKKWQAATGDIISYAISTDNGWHGGIYNNIWFKGYGGAAVVTKLKVKAKNAYTSLFHEISGFDLKLDGTISDTQAYLQQDHTVEDFKAYGQISQVWHKAVGQSDISLRHSAKICDFLQQIHLRDNSQSLNEDQVVESIIRYFKQFSYTFEVENEEQACYCLAWLLAEAAARPVNTSENITNTRVSFDNLIDKLTIVLNDNANQAVGDADSSEIQKELSENLARVKGKLLHYYYNLSKDPLFPAFKKPIDNDIEEIILKKFENEKILFNLLNNQIKTEPANEFYKKWLSFYFDRVAERVVFWLVVESNKDEFRNPKYWGGMHYRARSIRNDLWPVEIYLTRIQEE